MSFKYICEGCGSKFRPQKRYKEEQCRICDEDLKIEYVCPNCDRLLEGKEVKNHVECPVCDRPIPKDKVDVEKSGKVVLRNGKLTVDIDGKDFVSLEDIDEISLNILGVEIGMVKNPDFAEFNSIEDFEKTEEGVDLSLNAEGEQDLMEKLEGLLEKTRD